MVAACYRYLETNAFGKGLKKKTNKSFQMKKGKHIESYFKAILMQSIYLVFKMYGILGQIAQLSETSRCERI